MAGSKQPFVLDDEAKELLFIRNKLGMRIKYHGFLKGTLIWILKSFLHAAAFSVQIFMRSNIGTQTYTIVTVPLSVLWIRLFLLGDFDFQPLPSDSYYYVKDIGEKWKPFHDLMNYVKQMFVNFSEIGDALVLVPKGGSLFIFLYGYMILFLSLFNHLHVMVKDNVDRLSRGESIFFGWAYKNGNPRMRTLIRLLVEPLFVAGIGLLFFLFTRENGFGLFLIISAFAFFLRERAEYFDRLRKRAGTVR